MGSPKLFTIFVAVALLLAAIAAGTTYLTLNLRDREMQQDFELIARQIEQGEYDQARQALEARLDRGRGREDWYAEALVLRLDLQRIQGDDAGAQGTAAMLLDPERRFEGPPVIRAHAYLGNAALEAESASDAQPHFEAILALSGPDRFGWDLARLGLARIRMATRGVSVEVADELQSLLRRFPDSSIREEIEYVLGECNLGLLYSPVPGEGDVIYTVEPGNTIWGLAERNQISDELLLRINRIDDPTKLSVGRRLKVPNIDFTIEVDKTTNRLTLLNHGKFFKRYIVRTGQVEYMTPVGEYRVQSKKINPSWSDPRSNRTYPPLHAENELGSRWIGFLGPSLGIHETIHPETLGEYASNGCIGMLKADVQELYGLIRIGVPITIVGEIQIESKS